MSASLVAPESVELRVSQWGGYRDRSCEIPFAMSFLGIAGDIEVAFGLTVAGQTGGDVIEWHHDTQRLAVIGEFADIRFGSRAF